MNRNSSVHRPAAVGRLVSTTWTETNGLQRLRSEYDHRGRRVHRTLETSSDGGATWTAIESRTFVYDDWNLIYEQIERPSEGEAELAFFWGPDLSGSLQGAGGVGGLVAVSIDGFFYFPSYDNNGNVIGYWDESGSLVAEYAYDAFGNTISSSGSMASVFPHRFSTKYCDAETDLYYYGYRYYSPSLGRWISRDPIEEMGGINLLCFCNNGQLFSVDSLGELILLFDAPPQSGPNQSVHEAKIWEGRRKIMLFAMKLLTVSQSKWDTLSREGKIYFKDQVFRDTRSAYTQKVLRELLSVVIRPSDNSPQHYLESLEKWIPFADKPYDWVVFAIHGVVKDGQPTGHVAFMGDVYSQAKCRSDVNSIFGQNKSMALHRFVSCFQSFSVSENVSDEERESALRQSMEPLLLVPAHGKVDDCYIAFWPFSPFFPNASDQQ